MPKELVKIVATAVVAVREGDRVVNEIESAPKACYSAPELAALWAQAETEIAELNAAELATTPNRAARRRQAKRAPAKGGKKTS